MDETIAENPTTSTEPDATAAAEPVAPDESSCCAGNAHVPPRQPGVYAPITVDAPAESDSQTSDLVAFLKRTWRVWAIFAGVIVGLTVTVVALQSLSEWARNAKVMRYDRAMASLTPDRLIARCGKPEEDISKEVFHVVLRSIRYKPWIGEPLVFTFSKADDERNDWVFLTMKTENGQKSFDTAETKISAFSCLDSTK